ncbi:MAG: ATP synthase F0 subunit B [Bacteroidetes bacterium 43-93]|jgi:F-type H+-transporting ATPase subunit b|nr:F0F1 ATP synthase subunit B [Bacteroidota bacterium]MBS1778130.1 F0F1 ATP synthase subunit B [Bacteroidota bacterium]OJW99472.1 MAG: ATP synthase F0 subunit B [Bacteroidetes bacterium 43-93]
MDLLTPDLGLFVWTSIAFLLVFFILRAFAWKPILKSLTERETGIADAIASADRLKKEMSQMQAENEKIMAEARAERAAMLKEAKETRDSIINKAKEETKVVADKMIAEAQQQIQQQKMAALTEVKNEMGQLAVAVAEKVLRQQLATAESQNSYAKLLAEEIKMN